MVSPTNVTLQTLTSPSGQGPSVQPDLWKIAETQLSPKRQHTIRQLHQSSLSSSTSGKDIAEELKSLAEKRRDECEKQRWKFSFRGKEIILRDLAEKTIIWLTKFREIGDVVVNYDPVHLALPWAGVRFLLQCTIQNSQQMGTILTGVEMITRLMDQTEVYEVLYLHSPVSGKTLENLKIGLVSLYRGILELLADVCIFYDLNPARKILSTIFSPEKLEKILSDLVSSEGSLRGAVNDHELIYNRNRSSESERRIEKLNEILRDLEEPILRVDKQFTALLKKLDDHEKFEILCWLSKIPHEDNHKNAKNGRALSTGRWLIKHDKYRTWRKSSASTTLWLHGIPGAGKTKLITHVVDDLIECLNHRPNDEGLAFFYCDRNDQDRQDPLRIMQSLVKQLATPRNNNMLQSCLVDMYMRKKQSGFASKELDMAECQHLLYQYVDSYPQTTIVLDALDECNPRTRIKLIKILDDSVIRASRPVKILISSRDDEDIRSRFESGPNVAISATDNTDDIATFVAPALEEANENRSMKISHPFQREIITTLSERSHGMCQWAALQLNQLLEIDLEEDMRARLGRLPQGLRQAYDEIYDHILKPGGRTTAMAIRAFLWIMQTYVPLSPSQLLAACCQDPEVDSINAVDVDINFVLKICNNLIVIDHKLHVCLKFLIDDPGGDKKNFVNKEASRKWSGLYSQSSDEAARDTFQWLLNRYDSNELNRLLEYSTLYWSWHVRQCETSKEEGLSESLMRFLGHPKIGTPSYAYWCATIDSADRSFQPVASWRRDFLDQSRPWSLPVLAMCYLGLFHTLKQWWTAELIDPSVINLDGQTLLHLAAFHGHLDVCDWLIYHGADVNRKGGEYYGTALTGASSNGHLDIVQLLLDRGADVNLRVEDEYCRTALMSASLKGHLDIVQLLLDRGADVNLRVEDEYCRTALMSASFNGHLDIVRLLLDHGADVNDAGTDPSTSAFQMALEQGQHKVCALLRKHGAREITDERRDSTEKSGAPDDTEDGLKSGN